MIGDITVDILETPDAFYIHLFDKISKEFRCDPDVVEVSDNAPSKGHCNIVAKYRMRSMKDAAEMFALLHRFISNSTTVR